MTPTRLLSAFFVVTLALAGTATAQRGPNPQRAQERLDREVADLTDVLALTEVQQDSVRTLLTLQMDAQRKLFEQHQGDRRAALEAMQEQREKTNEAIMALLDESQKPKFKKWLDEQQERRRRRFGGRG